jgi:hypothetical protein
MTFQAIGHNLSNGAQLVRIILGKIESKFTIRARIVLAAATVVTVAAPLLFPCLLLPIKRMHRRLFQ